MSADTRISVQTSCPHGVFPDGSRRFKLTQNTVVGGKIVTEFQGEWGMTKEEAVWRIEGRKLYGDEGSRWHLARISEPKWERLGSGFARMVQWTGPEQTRGVCNLCILDEANRRSNEGA